MSRVSLSPSPLFFFPPLSQSSNHEHLPAYDRSRRISHPHNLSQGPRLDFSRGSEHPSSSQQRPNLYHQASRTIVDLTDELDDISSAPSIPNRFRNPLQIGQPQIPNVPSRTSSPAQQPSHQNLTGLRFGDRSNRMRQPLQPVQQQNSNAPMEVVDLTDDDDLVVTGIRPLSRSDQYGRTNLLGLGSDAGLHNHEDDAAEAHTRRLIRARRRRRAEESAPRMTLPRPVAGHAHPSISMPANVHDADHFLQGNRPSAIQDHLHTQSLAHMQQQLGRHLGSVAGLLDLHQQRIMLGMPELNYAQHAFADNLVRPDRMRKPEYVAPPTVEEGFTRSPAEEDVVICPGCEEELVAHKVDGDVLTVKKSGKAPSKTEREQHPFWLIKDCGHVFCNNCFQNRTGKTKACPSNFPDIPTANGSSKSSRKQCPVEGCDSEVNKKDAWVGLFL